MSWPTAFFASTLTICLTLVILIAMTRTKTNKEEKQETPIDDRTVTFPRISEYTHPQSGGSVDPRTRGGEGR